MTHTTTDAAEARAREVLSQCGIDPDWYRDGTDKPPVHDDTLVTAMLIFGNGMKPWRGGEAAPADWNGGRVLLASNCLWHPYQSDDAPDWRHYYSETGCLEPSCIVAYAAKAGQAS